MSNTRKYLVGMFDDDHALMNAVDAANQAQIKVADAFTPFPVHGLDEKMGLRPTKLHTAGFIFGATGTVSALSLMAFANAINFPIIFGGKPYFALASYIPITFELTVLFSGVGMVTAFYYLCNLFPGKQPKIIDPRTSDCLFALTFDLPEDEAQATQVKDFLKNEGALEVFEKEI